MNFKTFLKPPESVMVSLATAAVVYGIYEHSLPSVAEVHNTEAHNINIDAARKKAMWTSVAAVSGIFLLTRDPNVGIIGGLSFLALEWSHRHANSSSPVTGKLVPKSAMDAVNTGYVYDGTQSGGDEYQPEYFG